MTPSTGDFGQTALFNRRLHSADWWNTCVVRNLAEQGSRDGLDLEALLQVFDANYYEISNAADLPRETSSWLKKHQQIAAVSKPIPVRFKNGNPSNQPGGAIKKWPTIDLPKEIKTRVTAPCLAQATHIQFLKLEPAIGFEPMTC